MLLTFEDFSPGHFGTFGPRHVTRDEIIAFAKVYDPQPMHLDDEAANQSMLKGLSGSGWHLCSLMMRMIYDGFLFKTASLGAPGVNEVRWVAPLRPGDDLTLDVSVAETRPSNSRPDMGFVVMDYTIKNAKGEPLLFGQTPMMVKRRAGS